jgi:hypothetical protein
MNDPPSPKVASRRDSDLSLSIADAWAGCYAHADEITA